MNRYIDRYFKLPSISFSIQQNIFSVNFRLLKGLATAKHMHTKTGSSSNIMNYTHELSTYKKKKKTRSVHTIICMNIFI